MRILLISALCLVLATTASAQTTDFVANFETIEMPVEATQWWEYVQQCSGMKPKLGYDLAEIKWFRGPLRASDPAHLIIAHWAPNMIAVDAEYPLFNVTIAHELMHQLLQTEVHPITFWRCKLMPDQHPNLMNTSAGY